MNFKLKCFFCTCNSCIVLPKLNLTRIYYLCNNKITTFKIYTFTLDGGFVDLSIRHKFCNMIRILIELKCKGN